MVSAWWLVGAFIVGTWTGVILLALLSGNNR